MKVTERIMMIPTRMGPVGLGMIGPKVARLWLPGMASKALESAMRQWAPEGDQGAPPKNLARRITAYFEEESVEFDDPVDLSPLSEFDQLILTTLKENVGRGQVITYSQLATMAGKPGAARAVGRAMAKNPVPLIIPCHRVERADGAMGGFSAPGGIEQKRAMLHMEGAYP
ncbi:MAG: methylated-DNA--[protein]-cysteine S-methyltransferase [Nitrospinota bacterium]|nr:methylated-DNA--[protein]-cysteine S-methyltransferase [Nitrospinota bacterium]